MTVAKRLAKYAMVFYVVQAVIGIGVGLYLGLMMDPTEIERMVSCVTR